MSVSKKLNELVKVCFCFCLLLIYACNSNDSAFVYVNIAHLVKGEKLDLEETKYPTNAGHGYEVMRLKYYLSEISLENADGGFFSVDTVHLINAFDPTTCIIKLGPLPSSGYRNLSFIMGLDEEKNKEGNLNNTIQNNNMEWPVIGEKGYHYMKFEGKYDSLNTGKMKNFNLHTGPTGNNRNFVKIKIDFAETTNFQNNVYINMEMDINEILHHPNDYDFEVFGQGIMADQKAQEILKQNAYNVFRIVSVEEK